MSAAELSQITEIKDLIYFDFSKANSIYSQLTGGIIQQLQSVLEQSNNIAGDAGFNLQLFKSSMSGTISEKKAQTETKSLHHDLLNRLEKELEQCNVLFDINDELEKGNWTSIRGKIKPENYIRVEGWATIEDYEKIINISSKFNEIADFISTSTAENHPSLAELKETKENIRQLKAKATSTTDRNERTKQLSRLKSFEEQYNNLVDQLKPNLGIDEKSLNGLLNFLKIFFPKRINFRVYPAENIPDLQIFCNLKRECFVDIDSDNFSTAYGSSPNVKFTIFGIVSSLPNANNEKFDSLSEFNDIKDKDASDIPDYKKNIFIENAIRRLFRAFESFEDQVRHSRYPNLTLFPIAVYRKVKINREI